MFLKVLPQIFKIISDYLELEKSKGDDTKRLRNIRLANKLIRRRARTFRFLAKQLRKKNITAAEYTILRDALLSTF